MTIEIRLTDEEVFNAIKAYCQQHLDINAKTEIVEISPAIGLVRLECEAKEKAEDE